MSDWNISPILPPRGFTTTQSYWEPGTSSESTGNHTETSNLSLDSPIDLSMERPNRRVTPSTVTPAPMNQNRPNPFLGSSTPFARQRMFNIVNQLREQDRLDEQWEQEHNNQDNNNQQENDQPQDHQEQDNQQQREQENQSEAGSHHTDVEGQYPEYDLARVLQNLNITLRRMNQPVNAGPRETRLVELPIFKGGEQDPLTWLNDFYDACTANNITEERMLTILPAYLKGTAYTWWMDVGHGIIEWTDNINTNLSFVHRFRRKWCTSHQKSRWMSQLRSRTQKSGETVDEYWDAVMGLYQRVDPNRNYPAEDRMQQFISGLRDEIREPVEISIPTTMDEALNRARAVESTFSRNAPLNAYSRNQSNRIVNNELQDIRAVLTQLSQGFQQIATQQPSQPVGQRNNYNNNQQETRTCNKCGRIGHIARNCRSGQNNNYRSNNNNNNNNYNNRRPNNSNQGTRNCFTCNQPGHIAANCPQRNQQQTTGNGNNRNQWMNVPVGDFLETAKQVKESLN